jgi:hypothetical protein
MSGDARGAFGKGIIFKRGGIVTRYFKPKNPNTDAQISHREAFRRYYMAGLTQSEADLLYAAIAHLHTGVYAPFSHVHDHGTLQGLGDDDHSQYFNETRGDARYLRSVPQQDHGGLSGLGDDDHSQYYNQTRGDARYLQKGVTPSSVFFTLGTGNPYSSSQGTWVRSVNNGYLYCFSYYNSSNTNGDNFTLRFYLEAGTYKFSFNAIKSNNIAKVKVVFDGSVLGTTDLYSASTVFENIVEYTGISVATAGAKDVTFSVDGKNASSTAYYLVFQSFLVTRTG